MVFFHTYFLLAVGTGIVANTILRNLGHSEEDVMFFSIVLGIFFPLAWFIGAIYFGGKYLDELIGDEL